MKLTADGLTLELPPDWQRVDEQKMLTLCDRANGVGALQFSTAIYTGGEPPQRPTVADLKRILADFAASNRLDPAFDASYFDLPTLRAAFASFRSGDDFIRVWSVSDGLSFAIATYVCRWGSEAREVEQADTIVRSLVFSTTAVA